MYNLVYILLLIKITGITKLAQLHNLYYIQQNKDTMSDGRQVQNPDDRMPRYFGGAPTQSKASQIASEIKRDVRKVGEKIEDVAEDVGRGVRRVGQKTVEAARQVGSKAKQLGRKVQDKVQDAVECVKNDKFSLLHVLAVGVIIFVAAKIIRSQTSTV